MTQENKDLLLKDLCSRLPYNCRVFYEYIDNLDGKTYGYSLTLNTWCIDEFAANKAVIKPYLFPFSSMTDELWDKEFRGYGITEFTRDSFKCGCETLELYNGNPDLSNIHGFINTLIKNHFDIYGLIPMGLAIDATGKNIY